MKMNETMFMEETKKLLADIGKEEAKRLFSYEYCEVGTSFVGFLENYADLKELPKDFTIIDIGSYQSFQGALYKDHERYIGVEPSVPISNRLRQDNAEYFHETAQSFIHDTLPELIEQGLDLSKTFAVCSAVPDAEARKLVQETFPYHRVAYPAMETVASYPEGFRESIPKREMNKGSSETVLQKSKDNFLER